MTFLDLFNIIKQDVWPEGIARNLLFQFKGHLMSTMTDLQSEVPMLQSGQTYIKTQAETSWKCGRSYIQIPFLATVTRLEVFPADKPCCSPPIYGFTRQQFEEKTSGCGRTFTPPLVGPSDGGFYTPDDTNDSKSPPSEYFATILDGMLVVFPHINSDLVAQLTWTGIKRTWEAIDILPASWIIDATLDAEIRDYIRWKMEMIKNRCDAEKFQVASQAFADRRIKMMTDPARTESRQLDLKKPVLFNCSLSY